MVCAVSVDADSEEVTVSKVVKKTTKTTVVSSTEGQLHAVVDSVLIIIITIISKQARYK